MNDAKIRKLIDIFRESGVEEMEYRESFWRGMSLRLGRRSVQADSVQMSVPASAMPPAQSLQQQPAPAAGEPPPAEEDAHRGLHAVTSPMVGTFYEAPSPDAEPFVHVGDRVRAGQTVCIIEAMKIMNEIEADVDGEIVEIAAPNGEPVEYGQPLFRLRTA